MVIELLITSWLLMSLCVAVHAIGVLSALRRFDRSPALADTRFWPMTRLLIQVAGWLVLLHLIEITLWALLYLRVDAMPDIHSALYFSSVTYTTVGYGDLVLPEGWRLLGGVEALTGILMCGWSAAFFFAIVSRLHQSR